MKPYLAMAPLTVTILYVVIRLVWAHDERVRELARFYIGIILLVGAICLFVWGATQLLFVP